MKIKDYIIIVLAVLITAFFLRNCNNVTVNPVERVETVITHYDTIINTIVKEYHKTDLKPQIVYIDTNTVNETLDTLKGIKVNKYNDTINDSSITIFSEYLVDGKLLKSSLNYHLNIPEITKTVNIEYFPKTLNELFLTSSVGGNKENFSNLGVGLIFKSKKDWLIGYDYNMLQNSHNVTLGTRIFKK